MGAAAQFERRPHLHHPDPVAVLLREERHRAKLDRVGIRQFPSFDHPVFQHLVVHLALDGAEQRRLDRPMMGEVEAESPRLHQRSLLPDVGAEVLAERPVDQMGRAVIALDIPAARPIDSRLDDAQAGNLQ